MLISKNWLQDFVFLPDSLTPEQLALDMTMKTVEVEGVEQLGENLVNIVLGQVKRVEKHPDADRLLVCTVDAGDESVQVVCGGSNVKEGMKIALGKIGAMVQWHGEGEPIELKKTKIRGVASFGMICASDEIGLGSMFPKGDEKEILDLTAFDNSPGTSLAEVLKLNDIILDIDNKSMTHRPDLWGHYGMARELAAMYHKKLQPYNPKDIKIGKENKNIELVVDNQDKEHCVRYMAVALDNIIVGPSPDWVQKRLMAVGLRPINNIVDITNYVMLELGQPMHAFDTEALESQDGKLTICIRRADAGEEFEALDEKNYELSESNLVIGNAGKTIAVAGVIGGQDSSVSDDTSAIVFESANFDPTSVRRTAMALGVRTDSSARFEKSLDPANTELALRRAVELVRECCPGAKVVSNVVDDNHYEASTQALRVPLEFLWNRIGIEVPKKKIVEILESLGFGTKERRGTLFVSVPSWRATKDISIPEDIVEEVARVYGYDNIPEYLPVFPIEAPEQQPLRGLQRLVRQVFSCEFGLTESKNYSFVSPDWLEKIGIDTQRHIELENPIAKDRPLLRRSLLPNLLDNVEINLHRFDSVRLFEIGRTYIAEEAGERADAKGDTLLPRQDSMLGIISSTKGEDMPFYIISSAVRGACQQLGAVVHFEVATSHEPYVHPGRHAHVMHGTDIVGHIFELDPTVQESLGIPHRLAYAEINLNMLVENISKKSSYERIPDYPSVTRDIAFVVGRTVQHKDIVEAIKTVDPLITSVELFDVYEGKNVSKGKKSMAYHIAYRADDRTLRSATAEKIHENVVGLLQKEFGAEVR